MDGLYKLDYATHYGSYPYVDWGKVPDLEPRIPSLLAYCKAHRAAHELVVFDEDRLTYGQAVDQSALLARQLLAAGIGKGSRVGMLFPNTPRFIVTWLAIARIGAVSVPISTMSSAPELRRILRHADIQLLITADRYLNHDNVARQADAVPGIAEQSGVIRLMATPYLRAVWIWGDNVPAWAQRIDLDRANPDYDDALLAAVESAVVPSDPVSVIYTSGSTAEPKGVVHSHGNFMRESAKLVACSFPPFNPEDRVFTQMPFFWVGGLTMNLLNLMHRGATCIGSSRTGAALLDLLQRERVTYMVSWPHLARALAADPSFAAREFPAMRAGNLYEALPPALRPKDPGLIGTALGMTETCGPHRAEQRELTADLRGSFGRPMPGMQHRVIDPDTGADVAPGDVGLLLVRGDTLMLGLVKCESIDVFDADGWYRTGDAVSLRDGHFFFHGRLDDMIKTAGANVSPAEVEGVLAKLPGVVQPFVFSIPDPRRGAVVGAVVVVAPGTEISADGLRTLVARELSAYKVPRALLILRPAELPMASSGKADRKRMRKLLADAYLSTDT